MSDYRCETPDGQPRARAMGIPLEGIPGPLNAITDVPRFEVGYSTLISGTDVRTGVTALHPRGRADAGDPVVAGFHSQNGNGEMTGVSWISESGTFSGPIALTNTHSVGVAHAGIVEWTIRHHPELASRWLLPIAAETWDGYLNDANGHHVSEQDVIGALENARGGPLAEGSVGGGTGMTCYQFKGGSGTASRLVEYQNATYTVGVFVQANFGRRRELVVSGVPVGRDLGEDNPMDAYFQLPAGAGSAIAVVATDAPLLPHQCSALARRVTLGLGRTGTTGSHFSGDLFLALSTGNSGAFGRGGGSANPSAMRGLRTLSFVPWDEIDPLCAAVVQATEESVINSLVVNEEMVGREGHRCPALPRAQLASLLAQRLHGGANR